MRKMESLDSLSVTIAAEDSVLYESPYWGQHGISLYVTAVKGEVRRNILIDVAQNPEALLHNMPLLGIDPADIDMIVLTHCHYDHTQGLVEILKSIGKKDLPVIAHPDLFRLDFIVQPYLRHVGVMALDSRAAIEEQGGRLFLTSDPLQLLPGLMTTGYVKRQTDFEEVGISLKTIDENGGVIPDPMKDDISVMAAVGDKGLVLLTGCSHAGIVNIVRHATEVSGIGNVDTIIGGLHLVEAPTDRITKTVEALKSLNVGTVFAGHCTGFDAQVELRKTFGERFQPLRTGMHFEF